MTFFVAFLNHFWTIFRTFLTSFCDPGSGPVAGLTPKRGTLAGLFLVQICGSCGCAFFAELCPARRGRRSPRSTQLFKQKNVLSFLFCFVSSFYFFVFFWRMNKKIARNPKHVDKNKNKKCQTYIKKRRKKRCRKTKSAVPFKTYFCALGPVPPRGSFGGTCQHGV